MIILEHDHTRQIMTMWIDPADDHAIFLDQSETLEKDDLNAENFEGPVVLPGVVFRVPAMIPS